MRSWTDVLPVHPDDVGCDAVFEVLDRYVEAVLRGDEVTSRSPSVIAHLRNCVACREDTEGLLAVIRELRW